jgi:hypothetical protein
MNRHASARSGMGMKIDPSNLTLESPLGGVGIRHKFEEDLDN